MLESSTIGAGMGMRKVLLAVVGVYGVMSFVVSHRTRELGIRIALGSSRGCGRLADPESGVDARRGVALALPAVWSLGRLIESQLFGVGAMDWPTLLSAALLVACAALTASAVPVRRATAISPIQALRHE